MLILSANLPHQFACWQYDTGCMTQVVLVVIVRLVLASTHCENTLPSSAYQNSARQSCASTSNTNFRLVCPCTAVFCLQYQLRCHTSSCFQGEPVHRFMSCVCYMCVHASTPGICASALGNIYHQSREIIRNQLSPIYLVILDIQIKLL